MTNLQKKKVAKIYDYDEIVISLENSLIPSEKLDETPSMKDGLDRDTENDLRFFGCEMIQTAGLLLKLPQVAMATGQVLLQRFYFSKSMIKHDVEFTAMAAIFLAAKIEESPRRLRDIINVCQHIKQRSLQKPHTPMDYFSTHYFNLKNAVIKAERRILKDLGFCVHVKHPHKLIVTYLQMIGVISNVELAKKAWNYMNDSLRTDVFVRFKPEVIACACIFLAARIVKINLPSRPPWWQLFDASYDDIEDIALSIITLYSRPLRKISHLEAIVNKLKKSKQEKKAVDNKQNQSPAGSFTPSHIPAVIQTEATDSNSKPSSKTNSPTENRPALSSVVTSKNHTKREEISHGRSRHQTNRSSNKKSETESSEYSSDSEAELPSKKYAKQRKLYEKNRKQPSPSSESDNDRRTMVVKARRSVSPHDNRRSRKKEYERSRDNGSRRDKVPLKRSNDIYKSKHRSRSRSPIKRDKYDKEKMRMKDNYYDKYNSKVRR